MPWTLVSEPLEARLPRETTNLELLNPDALRPDKKKTPRRVRFALLAALMSSRPRSAYRRDGSVTDNANYKAI